jgi:hypothetical protein
MATATLTDVGRNLLRDARRGLVTDVSIKYVAVGTSSTAPAAGDTQLGAEVFRKALTSSSSPATGQGMFTLYLAPGDAVSVGIQEVGWFAGAGASGTANSGVLIAHGLYAHTKLASESIQVDFVLTE